MTTAARLQERERVVLTAHSGRIASAVQILRVREKEDTVGSRDFRASVAG
jgi:hypothetical protein